MKSGSASSARFTFADEPRNLNRVDVCQKVGGQVSVVEQPEKRQTRIDGRQHEVGVHFFAVSEHDARGSPVSR